ncbi:hypothetical protein ACN27G_18665 [Plantactinospora sp. WMMB334]|uniref:hypothetical protein n=1 Tax=Plantactinospora sp. WMMB334 TaxID=3404119 RepID=UPI003B929A0B
MPEPQRMRIPVFVSTPTALSDDQLASRSFVEKALRRSGLEPRTLGATDYPNDFPLKEVHAIGRHCSGGVILGFEQIRVTAGINKPGTPKEQKITEPLGIPTPWNQLEAGLLFGLGLPLIIFREQGVSGGIFDTGVTDVFLQPMPDGSPRGAAGRNGFDQVLEKWRAAVVNHYYRDLR